jgi:hypothetical protein
VAIVRATCPTCGDIELNVTSVQVQLCINTTASTYSFLCPDCRLIVNKDANETIVDSLTKAGARLLTWSLPDELLEPKVGPAICHDDLLEFHLALEDDSWQKEIAALSDRH